MHFAVRLAAKVKMQVFDKWLQLLMYPKAMELELPYQLMEIEVQLSD